MIKDLGVVAFCILTLSTYSVLGTLLLKTKWFLSTTGRNLVVVSTALCGLATVVILQVLHLLDDELAKWARFACYILISAALFWTTGIILKNNWHFWAWKKEDKDG